MSTDIALVTCKDGKTKKEVYKNVHSVVTINDSVRKKQNNNTRHLSVLMVAIDSVSRLNFQRCMPKTHRRVQGEGWYELRGYNKMGDNTFPNVMAISTGNS